MKEKQLREHADCDYCGKPIGHTGVPGFAVLEVKSYVLDKPACERQNALGQMIPPALAMVMGPDEDLANCVQMDTTTACWFCWAELLPQPGHRKADETESSPGASGD